MALKIDHTHEIAAPAELVWQVITDMPRYGEWNPFVTGCSSSLVVGEPIDMKVYVLPFFAQPQREFITRHEPGRSFCYGLEKTRVGALYSNRCHLVTPTGPDTCRYESNFEIAGWLSPLVALLTGPMLRRGFTQMSAAIRDRAESLARAAA